MGIFDAILGRSKPPAAELDDLFAVPQAALALESNGHIVTGTGSVCYRVSEGMAFAQTEQGIVTLLDADEGPDVERVKDDHGFTWLVIRQDAPDVSALVTDLHAANRGLVDAGFGASLLCTLINFTSYDGRPWGLVYLYKRGTFYPFVPAGDHRRDNSLELQIRTQLEGEVRIEADLQRWLAVWGAPGLTGG